MRLITTLATVSFLLAGCGGNVSSEDEGGSDTIAESVEEQTDDQDEAGEELDEE